MDVSRLVSVGVRDGCEGNIAFGRPCKLAKIPIKLHPTWPFQPLFENFYSQSHPQLLLNAPRFESHGIEKLFLSRNHLVEVFICIQIECRLNPQMPQNSLHRLWVLLRLVHKPAGRKWSAQNGEEQIGTLPLLSNDGNAKSVGFAYGVCLCHSRK